MDETTFINDRADCYLALVQRLQGEALDSDTVAAVVQECGKDWRTAQIAGSGSSSQTGNNGMNGGEQPATEKQLALLKRMGINPPAGLTKRSASELIDEAKMNQAA